MATAAPSPLVSSVEKTNGAKLSRLLIDGGTTVLRKIFDGHHPPANLIIDLNANYPILNNLLRRRVLNGHQWAKLFPPGGVAPDSKTFDITLLFLLLTNICGLSSPTSGWHALPPSGDTSHEANLARLLLHVVEELFALLFKEPLSAVGDPGRNMLMVIDGLDESEYKGRNELLDVIANQFCKLPIWIRFVVTTRPALNITEKLKHLKPFELKYNDGKNIEDVRVVFQKKLEHVVSLENLGEYVKKLVLKCEGLMLYRRIPVISPGLIQFRKGFWVGL